MSGSGEKFIDAESHYGKENTFEQVVLKQMQRCIDILSKEMVGGNVRTSSSGGKQTQVYVEDVRELVINSVDTFRVLVKRFIKKPYDKKVEDITEDIKKFKEKLGERKLLVRGHGMVKIKEMGMIDKDSSTWRELSHYKAEKYRELFEVLIDVYSKNKADIAAFSIE